MTDIEGIKTKTIYPQAIKQLKIERDNEESSGAESDTFFGEYKFNCSREVVVKIIDKIKKM